MPQEDREFVDIKIGELAKITGCLPVTIRFYEKKGLLEAKNRTKANYRVYSREDVERLKFIRHCRQHGISLAEIRQLLDFQANPAADCQWINRLIMKHLAKIDKQIDDLRHLRSHLAALSQACAGNRREGCGILESLRDSSDCAQCQRRLEADAKK